MLILSALGYGDDPVIDTGALASMVGA